MKSLTELGISRDHLVRIDLEGEPYPHIYPSRFVVLDHSAVVVGDELGIKVISYPYNSYRKIAEDKYEFLSDVGNFILQQGEKE